MSRIPLQQLDLGSSTQIPLPSNPVLSDATLTPGFEHYKPLKFLTISLIDTFVRCPRKFFYSYGCNIEPAGGAHSALKFGEAMHKALPILSTTGDFVEAEKAFLSIWSGQLEDPKRNTQTARQIMINFMELHAPGTNRSLYSLVKPPQLFGGDLKPSDTSDYEIPFAISLPNIPVPIIGRIDGLARHRDTQQLWGVEYKTASEDSARLLKCFDETPQSLCYTLALRIALDERVEGMMYEALLVSKTKVNTTQKPIYITDLEIDRFIPWLAFQCELILRCEQTQNFPVQRTGCSPYPMYGMPGYRCEFDTLCSVPDWRSLASLYQKGKGHIPFDLGELEKLTIKDVKVASIPLEVTA